MSIYTQNHSYANKSRHMYVCDVHQLLNTDESIIVGSAFFLTVSRNIHFCGEWDILLWKEQ